MAELSKGAEMKCAHCGREVPPDHACIVEPVVDLRTAQARIAVLESALVEKDKAMAEAMGLLRERLDYVWGPMNEWFSRVRAFLAARKEG